MRRSILLLLMTTLLCQTSNVSAQTDVMRGFICSAPHGKVAYVGNDCLGSRCLQTVDDGIRWNDDGFDGTTPGVVIMPQQMLVYWGNSLPEDFKPTDSMRASQYRKIVMPILHRDDVSAVAADIVAGGAYIYRYFFKTNILQRVSSWHPLGRDDPPAVGDLYVAKCLER